MVRPFKLQSPTAWAVLPHVSGCWATAISLANSKLWYRPQLTRLLLALGFSAAVPRQSHSQGYVVDNQNLRRSTMPRTACGFECRTRGTFPPVHSRQHGELHASVAAASLPSGPGRTAIHPAGTGRGVRRLPRQHVGRRVILVDQCPGGRIPSHPATSLPRTPRRTRRP